MLKYKGAGWLVSRPLLSFKSSELKYKTVSVRITSLLFSLALCAERGSADLQFEFGAFEAVKMPEKRQRA